MPTKLSVKGVWSAARNTQAELHEVNRPGYQGAPRVEQKKTRAKATPTTSEKTSSESK
nr:MAG TPA: hypothetical protein [Caudoviricetes sp.]